MPKPKIVEMILEQVREEIETEVRPERKLGAFRASELGQCPRRIQYTVLGKKPEKISPELALLFRDGDLHHNAIRAELAKIGCLSHVEEENEKEYTVELDDGPVTFKLTITTDCIFEDDYLIDIKSINSFSYQNLRSADVVKALYPGYYLQVQTYLDITEREWGALLFKNKNFGNLKIFWYQRDRDFFKTELLRLAKLHRTTIRGKFIKRPYTSKSKECKQCPMRIHCYKLKMESKKWS